jgi:thiol-disulfide isomerase/thioredoxin
MPLKITRNAGRTAVLALVAASFFPVLACAERQANDLADKVSPPVSSDAPARNLWVEAAGYDLYVGKVEDPAARVFQSPDYQKLLILPGTGEAAFVLTLKAKQVSSAPRTSVTATADGAALVDGASLKTEGALVQAGADLSFKSVAGEFRLTPEPPLLGEMTRDALLKKKGDYAAAAGQYKPKGAAVSLIKSVSRPVEIVVFFGTWCSYCKKWLPRFIKTMEAAGNPNITVRYVGIDENLSEPEALIAQFGISKTPTFVVRMNGKEIGRILEEPKQSMEEDLALMLLGK